MHHIELSARQELEVLLGWCGTSVAVTTMPNEKKVNVNIDNVFRFTESEWEKIDANSIVDRLTEKLSSSLIFSNACVSYEAAISDMQKKIDELAKYKAYFDKYYEMHHGRPREQEQ